MASVAGLLDYLAGDALTQLAQAYATVPGLARDLPAPFYTPGPSKPVGTAVKYKSVNGARESAKVSNPDAPSQAAQGVQTDEIKLVAIGAREHYMIGLDLIQALQHPGDMVRMNAQIELQTQVRAFVDRFVNIRTNAVHSAIIRGKIDVGSDGNIQTTTSSPVRTVDFSGDTGTQLTAAGGGTFAIGDWSSAATSIVTKVKTAKQFIAKTYGYRLTDCYYGLNVPEYLSKNTNFKEYLSRFQGFRDQFASTGEIPDGVLGLRWHPVDSLTTVSSGTATSWASADFLGFSPDPADNRWYEYFECGLPCPSGLVCDKQIADAMQLTPESMGSMFPVRYGTHSYTVFQADPISAKLIVADYAMPAIKNKNVFMRGVCV